MLTVLDEYSREALCVAVKPRMGNAGVLEALYPLFLKHGKPEFIRSDNGPEFIAENFQTWLTRVGIKPDQPHLSGPVCMLVHGRLLVHRDDGFLRRWAIAQSTMRSLGVVVFCPFFDDDLCLLQEIE